MPVNPPQSRYGGHVLPCQRAWCRLGHGGDSDLLQEWPIQERPKDGAGMLRHRDYALNGSGAGTMGTYVGSYNLRTRSHSFSHRRLAMVFGQWRPYRWGRLAGDAGVAQVAGHGNAWPMRHITPTFLLPFRGSEPPSCGVLSDPLRDHKGPSRAYRGPLTSIWPTAPHDSPHAPTRSWTDARGLCLRKWGARLCLPAVG